MELDATQTNPFSRPSTPTESCALDKDGNLKDASDITFFHSPSDEKPLSGPGYLPNSPTPVSKRPRRNANQAKFREALAADKQDSDYDEEAEASKPIAPKLSSSNKKRKKQTLVNSDSDTPATSVPKKKTKPKQAKVSATSLGPAKHFLKKSSDVTVPSSLAAGNEAVTTTTSITVTSGQASESQITTTSTTSAPTTLPSNSPINNSSDTDIEAPDVSISVAVSTSRRKAKNDVLTICREVSLEEEGGRFECLICA